MKQLRFTLAVYFSSLLLFSSGCDDSGDDSTSLDAAAAVDTAAADLAVSMPNDAAIVKGADAADAAVDVGSALDAVAADAAPLALAIEGNVERDGFPKEGSIAFVLVGNKFHFYQAGASADTSISFISPDGTTAYG